MRPTMRRSLPGTLVVVGLVKTEEVNHDEYSKVLHPLYVEPSVEFFQAPDECPESVTNEVRRAFSLFWCDQGSCANRIRSSVELLMNHFRIPKRIMIKGKFRWRTLHNRVELFKAKNPDIGSHLLALKWIGNTGSHVGAVTADDLFDGFEILNYALDELFLKRSESVKKLTKQINKAKRARSARQRRSKPSASDFQF